MNKLREYRTEGNYRQRDLAEKIGVTRQAFSCYELGIAKPPLDKAKKLADIFGVTIEDIFFSKSATLNSTNKNID